MKTKKSVVVVMLFTLLSTVAYSQTLNFSGTWKLNREKSDFGNMSLNSAPVQIKITQDKKQVSVERKQIYASGDSTIYAEKMTFDGKPSEVIIKTGLTKKSTLKWSDDKSKLLDEAIYSNGQTGKGSWSLSSDSKTLTLQRQATLDGNTSNLVFVYEKQ